ncbi:S-layer homology domain-containing protein [Bacillus sp. AK031]
MKRILRIAIFFTMMLTGGLFAGNVHADTADTYTKAEIKKMLRDVAIEKGIPPEILKGIALSESAELRQFNNDGTPLITEDGGIGLMQITMSKEEMASKGISEERLKSDIRYNIEQGANKLLEKWNLNLPLVNDHDKNYLEDWYFAVMAYNGLSKTNDPGLNPTGTYQERVYENIRRYAKQFVGETPQLQISYENSNIMKFPTGVNYTWPTSIRTSQDLELGDVVYTWNPELAYSNLRKDINSTSGADNLLHYTPLEITGGPYETENESNLLVMYKVKGNGEKAGYISSSNIIYTEDMMLFPDIDRGEVARAVGFLQSKGIINGHDDGTFKPDDILLRRHAAKLLVKALDLKLPEGYSMKATDMDPEQLGYQDMLIAEANGLIMGSEGKLNPNDDLTRSQMAKILVRAFKDVYETPTSNKTFNDQSEFWNYEDINRLYHNGITVVDTFKSFDPTSRSHFALFLERSIKLGEGQ